MNDIVLFRSGNGAVDRRMMIDPVRSRVSTETVHEQG